MKLPESGAPKEDSGSRKKIGNGLVAVSSAAILAVYAAGYSRTRPAADRLAAGAQRRPVAPDAAAPASAAASSETTAAGGPAPAPAPAGLDPAGTIPGVPVAPESKSARAEPTAQPGTTPVRPAPAKPAAPEVLEPVEGLSYTAPAGALAAVPAEGAGADHPADPSTTAVAAPDHHWKDGTFAAWGSCIHGDIQASITISGGQIVGTAITRCLTRYSCSRIATLLPQVVDRQSYDLDFVSGATESSEAFEGAILEAMFKAK